MATYTYTKSPVSVDRLEAEIAASAIVTALSSIQLDGTNSLSVIFKAELSSGDEAILNSLVAAHTGAPLPAAPNNVAVESLPALQPFAAKTVGTKKVYKRVHGIQADLSVGENIIMFTIYYPWVKITGMDIIGADNLDTADFIVLDSVTGQISGVPNYVLNQFGFSVNLSKDFYSYKSEFDADLYYGLQIKCRITTATAKRVGINFILNEVR